MSEEEIKNEVENEKDLEPEMTSYELLLEGKMALNVVDKERQQVIHYNDLLVDLFKRVEKLETYHIV